MSTFTFPIVVNHLFRFQTVRLIKCYMSWVNILVREVSFYLEIYLVIIIAFVRKDPVILSAYIQ
jgi:hypothetical protein